MPDRSSITIASRISGLAALSVALLPLCGCTTGSSASFTQAPLLFAEQTDPIATNPATPARTAMAVDPQAQPIPAYGALVGSGANVSLPTAAITAATRPFGDATMQAAQPVLVKVAAGSVVVSVGVPIAGLGAPVDRSSGTATVGVQTGALPPINAQANTSGAVSAAVATVKQVATNVPVVATVLQFPPVAGLGNAVGGTLGAVGATATTELQPLAAITSPIASIASNQPVMPAATTVEVEQSVAVTGTSLLNATSATLGKICVLKGCR